MSSNQPPLIPDIYRVGCLPHAGEEANLYLHHANADQAVLTKAGVDDLPAQEVGFHDSAGLYCRGSTDLVSP